MTTRRQVSHEADPARRRGRTPPGHRSHGGSAAARMTVHFIGAGPGAPDLITLRGRDLIAAADMVLYAGSLVPRAVVAHARDDAVTIDSADMTLDELIACMHDAHRAGKSVARVHSGDPSLYGAIGEQIRRLVELGVDYDITPGVPAYAAVAAALGQELTLPDVSQTVVLTRTTMRSSAMPNRETLETFALSGATLAIHLSARNTRYVEESLIPHYGADCPAVIAVRASWPDERIIRCRLDEVHRTVKAERIPRTALILVGRVLASSELHQQHAVRLRSTSICCARRRSANARADRCPTSPDQGRAGHDVRNAPPARFGNRRVRIAGTRHGKRAAARHSGARETCSRRTAWTAGYGFRPRKWCGQCSPVFSTTIMARQMPTCSSSAASSMTARNASLPAPSSRASSSRATVRYQGLRLVSDTSTNPAASSARPVALRRGHCEVQVLPVDVVGHLRRRLAVVGDQPVRSDEPATRLQNPQRIGGQRLLVRDVDDRILAEHDVDAGVRKRHRARLDPSNLNPVPEVLPVRPSPARGQPWLPRHPGPITRAAPNRSASSIGIPPAPLPISTTIRPPRSTPDNRRSTSSGPPGERNPSPHSSSRKRIDSFG